MARAAMQVPLGEGYSQMDWIRYKKSEPDLAGKPTSGPRRRNITLEEVKQHNTEDDAWAVLNGKVYNITPYIKYHPGGVHFIMKGAGRDATALFNKYHAWVNSGYMLDTCLVGLIGSSK
eukprot:jgi/Astpho2/2479/e_gw1.00048.163.1_t